MATTNINLLSTRPLHEALIREAAAKGILIDVLSFITTEAIETTEVQQEVELALQQSATVVFTSMNAVEAVAGFMQEGQPDWAVYCMGNTTRELVEQYFGEAAVQGTADNAGDLAELIGEEAGTEEVIFFCGDQRRDELPDILQAAGLDVQEITVYHTIATPHRLRKKYNGVLFYSPSAVDSFFTVNTLDDKTLLFAIGTTTEAALRKKSHNTIIKSPAPGKDNLVRQAIRRFSQEKSGE